MAIFLWGFRRLIVEKLSFFKNWILKRALQSWEWDHGIVGIVQTVYRCTSFHECLRMFVYVHDMTTIFFLNVHETDVGLHLIFGTRSCGNSTRGNFPTLLYSWYNYQLLLLTISNPLHHLIETLAPLHLCIHLFHFRNMGLEMIYTGENWSVLSLAVASAVEVAWLLWAYSP